MSTNEISGDIKQVIDWFKTSLNFIAPDDMFAALGHKLQSDSDFTKFAGEFLRASSTGVDGLAVDKMKVSAEDLRKALPRQIYSDVLEKLDKEGVQTTILRSTDGREFHIEKNKKSSSFFTITIKALHSSSSGEQTKFDLQDESDGTQRLLDLLPALFRLRTSDSVYVIDEIDRSMHPLLVWKFLQFFLESCPGSHSQIIVTTHEANLLDLDLLRRDEIWFVEKDRTGATQLYPLTEFSPRKDLELKKHYLQGRFGAVPFLGNIDRLLPAHCLPE